jgi:hypothetical protein
MNQPRRYSLLGVTIAVAVAIAVGFFVAKAMTPAESGSPQEPVPERSARKYQPRSAQVDTSGYGLAITKVTPWHADASLEAVGQAWKDIGFRQAERVDQQLARGLMPEKTRINLLVQKARCLNYEGQPRKTYRVLEEARGLIEANDEIAEQALYSLIYFQGVTALRIGEDDNCVLCRGESSCIFPISPAAVHTNPHGSRLAIKHFVEYLQQFPDDQGIQWLLNLAHMTLGEYPAKVDQRYLLRFDSFLKSEFDIGRFRDVGHLVGVNRLNQAGGGIMEDFDNDGLLDLLVTTFDNTQSMAFYRNKGDGTFEDRTEAAGLSKQLGGLYCVQGDYNNDGHMDVFICRGAWLEQPIRPTLLRNNGNGTFTDVTLETGLAHPVNSIAAMWADFDNDGFLDLFVCCEGQPNRLYRNKGDGTFEEVAQKAGVKGTGQVCKGGAWIDYDNDGYPDLFLTYYGGTAQLFHNNRDGTFTDVTEAMGISGPVMGFSCWAFDFDNDGWLDIFATSYDRTVQDVVKGMIGQPHYRQTGRLYRNLGGKGFKDVTKEAGLDQVYATMGSNFADFDNDGYLDIYLGTGDPDLATLVPNRMFKNVAGKRFAEITASSGTGHLQKGHSVACGDWRRTGNIDIFIETGGVTNGDKYHNILFQNPGQGNNWLTVKLVGVKTNRAAIGARIKAVTADGPPLTVHRHVSSGSSFGASPLQQTLGLGKAQRVALLEIYWPTSGTTQVFRDIAVNQAIEITEFAKDYRKLNWTPVPTPH